MKYLRKEKSTVRFCLAISGTSFEVMPYEFACHLGQACICDARNNLSDKEWHMQRDQEVVFAAERERDGVQSVISKAEADQLQAFQEAPRLEDVKVSDNHNIMVPQYYLQTSSWPGCDNAMKKVSGLGPWSGMALYSIQWDLLPRMRSIGSCLAFNASLAAKRQHALSSVWGRKSWELCKLLGRSWRYKIDQVLLEEVRVRIEGCHAFLEKILMLIDCENPLALSLVSASILKRLSW